MKEKFAKQKNVHKFSVGNYVSVKVPCIDRCTTDHKRVPCVIVEVRGKSKTCCRTSVLQTC